MTVNRTARIVTFYTSSKL